MGLLKTFGNRLIMSGCMLLAVFMLCSTDAYAIGDGKVPSGTTGKIQAPYVNKTSARGGRVTYSSHNATQTHWRDFQPSLAPSYDLYSTPGASCDDGNMYYRAGISIIESEKSGQLQISCNLRNARNLNTHKATHFTQGYDGGGYNLNCVLEAANMAKLSTMTMKEIKKFTAPYNVYIKYRNGSDKGSSGNTAWNNHISVTAKSCVSANEAGKMQVTAGSTEKGKFSYNSSKAETSVKWIWTLDVPSSDKTTLKANGFNTGTYTYRYTDKNGKTHTKTFRNYKITDTKKLKGLNLYGTGTYKLKVSVVVNNKIVDLYWTYHDFNIIRGGKKIGVYDIKKEVSYVNEYTSWLSNKYTFKVSNTGCDIPENMGGCVRKYKINHIYQKSDGSYDTQHPNYSVIKNIKINKNETKTLKIKTYTSGVNSKGKAKNLTYILDKDRNSKYGIPKSTKNVSKGSNEKTFKVKYYPGTAVINVYYKRYTAEVRYYYDGVEDKNASYEVYSANCHKEITAKNKSNGYIFKKKKLSGAKSGSTKYKFKITRKSGAKVKIYYTSKKYDYEIHYYYNGVEDKKSTAKGTIKINESNVITVVNKNTRTVNGTKKTYVYDKSKVSKGSRFSNWKFTVRKNKAKLKVYYKLADLNYEIHYFYDGVEDTNNKVSGTVKTTMSNIVTVTNKNTRTVNGNNKTYHYSKCDVTSGSKISNWKFTVGKNKARLNVHYVSSELNYTIRFFYDGKEDTSRKITGATLPANTKTVDLNNYRKKGTVNYLHLKTVAYNGKYTSSGGVITFKVTSNNAVLDVYYVSSKKYTIYYYLNDELYTTKTGSVKFNQSYNITADDLSKKHKNFIFAESVARQNAKRTGNYTFKMTGNDAVFVIYYDTKTTYKYTIRYYYDDVEDSDRTITKSVPVNSKVTAPDKPKDRYTLDKDKTPSMTFNVNSDNFEFKVYYKKKPNYVFDVHLKE